MSKVFSVNNPTTSTAICDLEYMGYAEATKAINEADQAFASWKDLLPQKRADILEVWYHLMESQKEEIAQIMQKEQGKPVAEAIKEIEYGNSFVRYYAQEALRLFGEISPHFKQDQWSMNLLEPIGVVGAITPWNFPHAMITKKIAPALAAGCPVVLKPSEETPLTAIKIRDLAIQAGVPKEVFGIVYGDFKEIGKAFVESSKMKMISFTGSIPVGKYLMRESAETVKKVVLELGGNAPCIVFEDADLELAVKKIAQGKFRSAGQACTSPNRIFVHESILDKFNDLLIKEISGNDYIIGPLINRLAKVKAQELLDDAIASGAKLLYRCSVPKDQKSELYFAPAIIDNLTDDMEIVKEEAFSPIFSILSFKDDKEVIARSNDTKYGLAAYLFSSDLKRGLSVARSLNFGVLAINDSGTTSEFTPHGGTNESGVGREGGKIGLLEYYENKFIVF
jgi:acyl-CoA reductase-like NAD-dependent aldehyde dehydrogenase